MGILSKGNVCNDAFLLLFASMKQGIEECLRINTSAQYLDYILNCVGSEIVLF